MVFIARLLPYLLLFAFSTVLGVPTWDGWNRQQSISSLVPGSSFIEALGPARDTQMYKGHLSTAIPGTPGNLTLIQNTQPPMYFINQNWLWQINNETSIFRVNVVNTTGVAEMPLQLKLGTKAEGIKTGSWRWRGTMLYYDQTSGDSQGLFYSCPAGDNTGIFMFLKNAAPPAGCSVLTLHTFTRRNGWR
ncbi:hypothetical protein EYR36_005952 [Pleurotus pulmonarius]|nr:hypothetical protein EYR36_005952 [Pleurotus pulmonarius]KAF4600659.1 hypothetical protein EYR38_005302 [Pleurotus pulmonarius]